VFFIFLAFSAAVFINGATDAANALTGPVACGALKLSRAALLAACMNLLGMLTFSILFPGVYETVSGLAHFPDGTGGTAVAASLIAVVLWSGAAWIFGIPTSESHGLFAALAGASIALGAPAPDGIQWIKVAAGLILSILGGGLVGALTARLRRSRREKYSWKKATVLGCAGTAFLHGAQDGQKFLGLMGAAGLLTRSRTAVFCCALLMLCGTLFGGRRIVQKMGHDMADVDAFSAACADIGSAVSLFAMTLAGLPVSTTHVKMTAMASAAGGSGQSTDKKVILQVILAWITTFPGCFLLAYFITKLIKMQ